MGITTLPGVLREARRRSGLTQRDLAERAGTSQSAIARIERGQSSPTLATLERLLGSAGFEVALQLVPRPPVDPVIEAYKRDVDRTLLRENLKKSVDDRLRSLVELQEAARELRNAGRAVRRRR